MVSAEFVGGDLRFSANTPLLQHFRMVAGSGDQADDGVCCGRRWLTARRVRTRLSDTSVPPGQFVSLAIIVEGGRDTVGQFDRDVVQQTRATQAGSDQQPGGADHRGGFQPRSRSSR